MCLLMIYSINPYLSIFTCLFFIFIYLSIPTYLPISLSVCLSVPTTTIINSILFVCLSIYLSIYLSIDKVQCIYSRCILCSCAWTTSLKILCNKPSCKHRALQDLCWYTTFRIHNNIPKFHHKRPSMMELQTVMYRALYINFKLSMTDHDRHGIPRSPLSPC